MKIGQLVGSDPRVVACAVALVLPGLVNQRRSFMVHLADGSSKIDGRHKSEVERNARSGDSKLSLVPIRDDALSVQVSSGGDARI